MDNQFRFMEGFHPLEIYHNGDLICVVSESKYSPINSRLSRLYSHWFDCLLDLSEVEGIDFYLQLSSVYRKYGRKINKGLEQELRRRNLKLQDYEEFSEGWKYISKGSKFIDMEAGVSYPDFVLFQVIDSICVLKIPSNLIGT